MKKFSFKYRLLISVFAIFIVILIGLYIGEFNSSKEIVNPISIKATIEDAYNSNDIKVDDIEDEIRFLKDLFPSKAYDMVFDDKEINDFVNKGEYKILNINIDGDLEEGVTLSYVAKFIIIKLEDEMYIFEPTMPTNKEYNGGCGMYWNIVSSKDTYQIRPTGLIHINFENREEIVTSKSVDVSLNIVYSDSKDNNFTFVKYDTVNVDVV